jgi:hypothetical protein
MQSTNQEQNLREKVFEICENLYENNEKINRDIVRERLGGGSFTQISPLVAEWRRLKNQESVQIEEEESTDNGTKSSIVKTEESEITESPEEINATINTDFIPDGDLEHIVRSGAEKATGLLIAQEAVALHFYQNPDQLPPDLKVKLEGMRGNFTQSRRQISRNAYDYQNLINLSMKKVAKKQDDLELIG